MSNADRSSPVRSCIGCRQRRPAADLVRVTMSAPGFDVDGSSNGRGAWLCRATGPNALVDGTCLEQALARRAFGRAWKRTLDEHEEQALREQFARVDDENPDAH